MTEHYTAVADFFPGAEAGTIESYTNLLSALACLVDEVESHGAASARLVFHHNEIIYSMLAKQALSSMIRTLFRLRGRTRPTSASRGREEAGPGVSRTRLQDSSA